jgi:hypothetical protein
MASTARSSWGVGNAHNYNKDGIHRRVQHGDSGRRSPSSNITHSDDLGRSSAQRIEDLLRPTAISTKGKARLTADAITLDWYIGQLLLLNRPQLSSENLRTEIEIVQHDLTAQFSHSDYVDIQDVEDTVWRFRQSGQRMRHDEELSCFMERDGIMKSLGHIQKAKDVHHLFYHLYVSSSLQKRCF